MQIPKKILYVGAITFLCTFSTLAVAQHLLMGSSSTQAVLAVNRSSGFRELPIFFPQGKLYCANGGLAYQKLYPHGWQRLTDEEAVTLAVQSVDEACVGAAPELCKEYRARLSKLRAAIRTCS